MIKLTRNNKDILFTKYSSEFTKLTRKLLHLYGLVGIFEATDLVNETYLKLVNSKKEFVDNEDHFCAFFYVAMKWTAKQMFRRYSLRKQVEFNPDYHSFTGSTINGIFADDFIKNTLNGFAAELPENMGIEIVKKSIDEIRNPVHKRLINLLSYQLDYDRISEITGIQKGVNLRTKVHSARLILFSILQKNGVYTDKTYADIKTSKIKTSNCLIMEFDKLNLNKTEYMYNDYPMDETFENKVLFILTKFSPIEYRKLVAIIALNEDERTNVDSRKYVKFAIGNIKNLVKNAVSNLEKDNSIHREESVKIYSNL